jgi:ATP/ADP translocase
MCPSCDAGVATPSHPAQLSNTMSSEALFYTCIIPFIMFFGAFAAIMYPMRDALHPTGEAVGGLSAAAMLCRLARCRLA